MSSVDVKELTVRILKYILEGAVVALAADRDLSDVDPLGQGYQLGQCVRLAFGICIG